MKGVDGGGLGMRGGGGVAAGIFFIQCVNISHQGNQKCLPIFRNSLNSKFTQVYIHI